MAIIFPVKKRLAAAILLLLSLFSVFVAATHLPPKTKYQNTVFPTALINQKFSFARNPISLPIDAIPKKEFSFGNCLDSDVGLNYFQAGSATYFPPMTSRCQAEFAEAMELCRFMGMTNCLGLISEACRPKTIGDRCISGSTLREAYCSNGQVYTRDYRCPSGCNIAQCISFR